MQHNLNFHTVHGPDKLGDEERPDLRRFELDASYPKLYAMAHEDLCYILNPQYVYGPDFPGEKFRVLKEKEIKPYGEYRTRRLVLEGWDRLEGQGVGEKRIGEGMRRLKWRQGRGMKQLWLKRSRGR